MFTEVGESLESLYSLPRRVLWGRQLQLGDKVSQFFFCRSPGTFWQHLVHETNFTSYSHAQYCSLTKSFCCGRNVTSSDDGLSCTISNTSSFIHILRIQCMRRDGWLVYFTTRFHYLDYIAFMIRWQVNNDEL
jgi:hypothetical protein